MSLVEGVLIDDAVVAHALVQALELLAVNHWRAVREPLPARVAATKADLSKFFNNKKQHAHQRLATSAIDQKDRPGFLTTSQVADLLQCSRQNVTALVRRKRLPARKSGRSWVFDPLLIQEYVDEPSPRSHREAPGEGPGPAR